ncbi:BTB/POZ domain-containing protein 1-like [Oppia nitens]|uniref:BTB/POZ domain-containing protein 1-like n=1 Tax=Oppia nitens TaxID=1686743 RepID=UPI0023DC45DB|nr:BTB/POZ domain-containing protein 1-like [Oppia nitens]
MTEEVLESREWPPLQTIGRRGQSVDESLSLLTDGPINHVTDFSMVSAGVSTEALDDQLDEEETLSARFSRLLSTEDMSDVHFVVGFNRKLRIPAHKLVLSVASPVFKNQFFGIRDADEEDEDIVLSDVEAPAFLEFLRFCYSDKSQLTKDNVVGVLFTALKFEATPLERRCERYLRTRLDSHSAFSVWISAKKCRFQDIEAMALKAVERWARVVCLSTDFCLLSDSSIVKEILLNNNLRISESDLFVSVCRWAKSQCLRQNSCPTRVNLKQVFGDLLSLIRFPLMTAEDIKSQVQTEGLLEEDQIRSLLSARRTWPRVARSLPFSSEPRLFQRLIGGQLLSVQRFGSFDNQLPNSSPKTRLSFRTNKTIFVSAIGVYGPRKPSNSSLEIRIRIERTERFRCRSLDSYETQTRVKSDSSEPVITVRFDEEFEVEAEVEHQICAEITLCERIGSRLSALSAPLMSRSQDVHFFYGTDAAFAQKVKPKSGQTVVFNFRDDCGLVSTEGATSAPPTPHPPPRPPPPEGYVRRVSRFDRLKRALSFTEKKTLTEEEIILGQIPVILFYL